MNSVFEVPSQSICGIVAMSFLGCQQLWKEIRRGVMSTFLILMLIVSTGSRFNLSLNCFSMT